MAQLSQTYTAPATVQRNATEIGSVVDQNNAQLLLLRRLAQIWEHTLAGGATLRTFGDALKVVADGLSMNVTVTGGAPILFDLGSDPGGTDPQFLLHQLGADDTFTVDAADATNPRIDVLSAKVEDSDFGDPETRIYKDSATGEILSQSFNKRRRTKLTVTYTPGVPGAVPVAPAPPAGEVVVAEIAVAAAATEINAADVTDLRSRFGQEVLPMAAALGSPEAGTPSLSGGQLLLDDGDEWLVPVPLFAGQRLTRASMYIRLNPDSVNVELSIESRDRNAGVFSLLDAIQLNAVGELVITPASPIEIVANTTYWLRARGINPAGTATISYFETRFDRQP
jgi:hypothetical protein